MEPSWAGNWGIEVLGILHGTLAGRAEAHWESSFGKEPKPKPRGFSTPGTPVMNQQGAADRRRLRRITAAPCLFGSADVAESWVRAWPIYRTMCSPSRLGKPSGNAWRRKRRMRRRRRKEEEEEEEEEEQEEPFGSLLGHFLGLLGVSWGSFGGLLGASLGLLGAFGGFLGASLAVLGRSWPV